MSKSKAPAEGDRIDLGGKLPQFDVFAKFAYRELVYDNLAWIKVADPKAEKLDDILYATKSEIHAYQLKWSNKQVPSPFSYNDFKPLFLECVSGWKAIKLEHASDHKKVIAHLLTNRSISTKDSIKNGNTIIGSFNDFLTNVWKKLKSNQAFVSKWKPIVDTLRTESKLNKFEFIEFIEHFEFHPAYNHQNFKIGNLNINKQNEDLIYLSRLLLEEVANKEKIVHYTSQELINALNWQSRFKTTFFHELIIDKNNYQPITTTIDKLDQKIEEFNSGYLFMVGGPGTGKSTLLTDWSKNRRERVIRYYAFDFTNPSSLLSDHERGEADNLFFDLVLQLKNSNIRVDDVQPYKELTYLKKVFEKQIESLGNEYSEHGTKTIIIIDGLDHIPREYTQTSNSFLAHLPKPDLLPEGIYIILGSQSYDLNDLRQEVKLEYGKEERTIKISSLIKKEVFEYLDSGNLKGLLSEQQKQILFEKSQGHPLYLSYQVQKVAESDNIIESINNLDVIDGDIDTYYYKMWEPISNNTSLIELLGLIARINGSVSVEFISEWGYQAQILLDFRKNAKFLFDESDIGWTFFHNSFRQFLIQNTALNILSNKFDDIINKRLHNKLANHYEKSLVENNWKKGYHLYMAGEYEQFLIAANPNEFITQFLNFRPAEEIKRDIKLGIEVAKHSNDVYILIRYLFALSELQTQLFNIDPISFLPELLKLGEISVARNYIRNGNILLCNEASALMASRLFIEYGNKVEANIIFNISEPDNILKDKIIVEDNRRYEEVKNSMEEWVKVAPYFYKIAEIILKINNIEFLIDEKLRGHQENEVSLRIDLLEKLAESLINQKKWLEFEYILNEFDLSKRPDRNTYFLLLQYAIEESLDNNDDASKWLSLLLDEFPKDKTKPITRIYLADMIYKVSGDVDSVREWIKDISQPLLPKWDSMGYESSLEPFIPKIKLNKLLNICGEEVSIIESTPYAEYGSDEEVAVEFERMLGLITKILSKGLQNKKLQTGNLTTQLKPIVEFYYKDVTHRNSYWFKLKQAKAEYINYLVYAVSLQGIFELTIIGDYLIEEFIQLPKFWPTAVQRKILLTLLDGGFDSDKIKHHLKYIETIMIEGHDISEKIDECKAQANAWITLSEDDLAKKWIKESFEGSLGVGYRKDYQFNTWTKWLQKINKQNPETANEKLMWFLSHLKHVKETTEAGEYSYEILQNTFQWNFYSGRLQLEWQLENDLISFQDALLAFVENFIERAITIDELNKIISLYTEIYLFVTSSSPNKIITSYLEKGFQIEGREFIENNIEELVKKINIKAFEGSRFNLLSSIKSFTEANFINIKDYVPDFIIPENTKSTNNTGSNEIVLKDNYERLSEKEVLNQVTNFSSFKMLFDREDKANSYFNWTKTIEQISSKLSIENIIELSKYEKLGRRETDTYATLSSCALCYGKTNVARELAEKAVFHSNSYGWNKWYDGGTRITAFLALKKVDNKYAMKKAFEFLAHDSINYSDPDSLCQQLEKILPCLTNEYDIGLVWKELFDHLLRLMSSSFPLSNLPKLSQKERPITEDLMDLLFYLTKNPVNIVFHNAQKLLASFVTVDTVYIHEKLKELFNGNEEDQEVFIHILMMTLSLNKNDALSLFTKELNLLALSNNYQIRNYSSKILKSLGRKVPVAEKKEVPAIYSLYLESNKVKFKQEQDPLNPKIDLNDPEDLIKPYDYRINILEKKTGVKKINLTHRMVSLMKEVDNPERWTEKYDKELINHLRNINLEYAYPRPRAKAAKRGLMHLIAELIDSHKVELAEFDNLIEMHDHQIYFMDEISKPNFIPRLVKDTGSFLPSTWLDDFEKNERIDEGLIQYQKGWYIIGEYTKQINLAWGRPTEIYMVKLVADEINNNDESDYHIYGSAYEVLAENYHYAKIPSRNVIVIHDHFFDQFDKKSRWLAFNPLLAKYLNWEPDINSLFAWKDEHGDSMVKSIYWVNGNVDMPPPHHGHDTGQGWVVIASKKAIKQIQKVEPNLIISKELKRYKTDDGVYKEKKVERVVNLKIP